ncbi:MAG: hypothetical protein KZQ61_13560 [Candidatus Thiodiazotropha sp. (ex Lucinoma aequizonata)]|nr:hypothetical protein [Candidatus Thiodiazotropha sp. (ex Lucinoma aequizonata)]
MLNSHLIGFLALPKERVRLLPFGWHPETQLLGAHLNSYFGGSIFFSTTSFLSLWITHLLLSLPTLICY